MTRHIDNDWKIIGIILCVFVALLFGLIAFYACWKICWKASSNNEDVNSLVSKRTRLACCLHSLCVILLSAANILCFTLKLP